MKRSGSIDQLPSGRWRLRVSNGRKQITVDTYDTREEAERERDAAVAIAGEHRGEYEGLTVKDLGQRILTRREVKHEVRDPGSDWSRWDKHIKNDEIGRIAVAKLQPKHVHAWLGRMKDKGLAMQTIRNTRNLLSVVMAEACEQGAAKHNPCSDVRLRSSKVSTEAGWTYLTPEEQSALIAATPMPERCIVAFAIATGLRAGELVSLRHVDIVPGRTSLFVRYGEPPDLPTKTGRVRQVPIFPLALSALHAWLRETTPREGCDAVFPLPGERENRYGAYRDKDHVLDWAVWKAALKAAGLTRRVRWHDLRHTCASSLVSGWWGRTWSLLEVKEMLGHTSIDITQRYAHLAPGPLQEAALATGMGQVRLVTEPSAKALPSADKTAAPSAGVGPATNGLGSRGDSPIAAVTWPNDLSVTDGEETFFAECST